MNLDNVSKSYLLLPHPDFIYRKKIEEEIKENNGYCNSIKTRNENSLCTCKEFSKQKQTGFCKGKRYYKVLNCPKVCLCGSTRFKDKFIEIAKDLTLQGYIVTMPMVFIHHGDTATEQEKQFLDEIHKAKIADADIVYILNVDGYIGESTKSEIVWANELGKRIEYLES